MLRVVSGFLAGALLLLGIVAAREKTEAGQSAPPQEESGMSTAGAHAAVLDAENRPITAGGFVDSGPIVFQDVAEKCASRGGAT
jgi:hypothetical protein